MASQKTPRGEPIAIVGSGCRFAGDVTSPSALWELLSEPIDLTREIPANRFNIKGFFHPDGEYNGTTNSPKAYFLNQDHKAFDASFFNILPKEAEAIDPQQRLVLEVVYEAMESAGYSLQQYAGRNVAVYAGIMTADYDTQSQRDDLNTSQYYATGNARSILANRISYFFNFGGASMAIDTACSSSLVALDQAVNSLRAGKSEMACVTGVNMILTPEQFIAESSLHMLSPTGHCRMWDSKADGYARGEGVAAVLVKTLSRAIADGDQIEAIIREIGVNSDGRTKGITMPSWAAQADLIRDTYARAGLDPTSELDRCQFFEAHGTGTAAGDPNEARAIQDAFFGLDDPEDEKKKKEKGNGEVPIVRVSRPRDQIPDKEKLLVGSIKTVVGHTEGAAGLAGLLKVIQLMKHDKITRNLHLDELSPAVAEVSPDLKVATELQPWPAVPDGQAKRASVNSFGFGGTNSHVIVEQYLATVHDKLAAVFALPESPVSPEGQEQMAHLAHVEGAIRLPITLSGNTRGSLGAVAKAYRHHILSKQYRGGDFNPVAWHTYARRTAFAYRASVAAESLTDVLAHLDAVIDEVDKDEVLGPLVARAKSDDEQPRILGVFTGQGAQWATMSRQLMRTNKTYAQNIRFMDECLQGLRDGPTWRLEEEIMADKAVSKVNQAEISQPLCTAMQIAFLALFQKLNIKLHAVVGHSSGEIAAAHAAGRLSLRDAIAISYYRGKFAHLAQGRNGEKGGMLAAGLTLEEAEEWCNKPEYGGTITVAAINTNSLVTISGDINTIDRLFDDLEKGAVFTRRVKVDTAYHSPHMSPAAEQYLAVLDKLDITPTEPSPSTKVKWVSSVSEDEVPDDDALKSMYWVENMVKPVRFFHAVKQASADYGPFHCVVEIGPHPALKGPVSSFLHGPNEKPLPYSGVLDRTMDDRIAFAQFLGWMWKQFGSAQNQIRTYVKNSSQPEIRKERLPSPPMYPWDHTQSFIRESRVCRQYHFRTDPPHELLGVRTRDDDQYLLRWRNVLMIGQLPWGTGHTFQGAHLVPGSGYCSMAYDAAKMYLSLSKRTASVVELVDLHFYSGITLDDKTPGVETLFSLTIDDSLQTATVIEGSFTLTSCLADGTTDMKKNFGGKLRIVLGEPSFHALPARIKRDDAPETARADPVAFYAMMKESGLVYTGPFQGLTTLEKRTSFASGTVQQVHDDDQTTLVVSPATLDSCLQTAFVTVSSPGDKSLWTSFLPATIDCMRFNVASCEGKANTDMLNVDAYLTDAKSFSHQAAASFTADIEIFGKEDRLQIQVQGLTVASFSTTKPEDDHELYLTTVLDLDPDVQMVENKKPGPNEDDVASPVLVESCKRVAAFYTNNSRAEKGVKLPPEFALETSVPANGWPQDTQETIDAFISASPFFASLDFVRRVGKRVPSAVYGLLPEIIIEGQHLMRLQKQVSRLVKQIAHKYPRMNVLGWTNDDFALSEHILDGLDNSFLTFRVGGDAENNIQDRVLTTPARKKKVLIRSLDVNAESAEPRAATATLYDLVVLTTTMFDPEEDEELPRDLRAKDQLDKIHSMMRPGGFLVLVHSSADPLWERLAKCLEWEDQDGEAEQEKRKELDWNTFMKESGFMNDLHASTQKLRPTYSIMIRQAKSDEKRKFRFPSEYMKQNTQLAPRLLIVGGCQAWTGAIKNGLNVQLGPHCGGNVTLIDNLDRMNIDTLAMFPAVIFLADIDAPILRAMTAERMEIMRALMSPGRKIVWATFNARVFPDNAASLGFVRTLLAETPGLRVQVLDLTSVAADQATHLIKATFARLVSGSPDEGKTDRDKPLFINETEVYIQNNCPYVARCLPWKNGNKRNNAPRRIVNNDLNSLEKHVQLSYALNERGSTGYEVATSDGGDDSLSLENPQPETIRVEYSTADALNLGNKRAYIWLGRDLVKGMVHFGLSNANASYLTAPAVRTADQSLDQVNQPLFVALLARYLAVITLASSLEGKSVVLVEPDPLSLECAKDVLVQRNIHYLVFTTDAASCDDNPSVTFVHANASVREIKAIYPPGVKFQIVNMLPGGSDISRVLESHLPKGSKYHDGSCFLAQEDQNVDASEFPLAVWSEAVSLATARVRDYMDKGTAENPAKPDLISAPEVTRTSGQLPPFRIVDWKADRSVPQMVTYFPKPVLSANKTYIMVGITRDFGQSLCHLFVDHGARHIILCSRSPPAHGTKWQRALKARGANIEFQALDVTDHHQVIKFKQVLEDERRLVVGGVVNGAMVLEDKVFSEMSVETLHRVMRPKTDGSRNLSIAFPNKELEFFIMTSSFAAIGGHAGQSNYAAANMYMNGLAAKRRVEGLAGSVLNIGVIYGIGFLHREKSELYDGLEREGYPPISERDIHHMFIEAIKAGKGYDLNKPPRESEDRIYDIVTGLARYSPHDTQHYWQQDPRFSHYTKPEEDETDGTGQDGKEPSIKELLDAAESTEAMMAILLPRFLTYLDGLLRLGDGTANAESNISADLGVDSLVGNEIRHWFYKNTAQDIGVMKMLGAPNIERLLQDTAVGVMEARPPKENNNGNPPLGP